jgi:hypothetical protein
VDKECLRRDALEPDATDPASFEINQGLECRHGPLRMRLHVRGTPTIANFNTPFFIWNFGLASKMSSTTWNDP